MKKILAAVVAFTTISAQAEFFDGNELYRMMISNNLTEKSMAAGYVAGAADAGMGVAHCAPNNVSLRQMRDVVQRELEQFPNNRHYSADSIVQVAANKAWPCENRGRRQS